MICSLNTAVIVFMVGFAVAGVGLISTGSFVLYDLQDSKYAHLLDDYIPPDVLPTVLIATGSIVFLVAFLACYAIIKGLTKLLMTIAVILAIIAVIELAVGIGAAVYKQKFTDDIKGLLNKSMIRYQDNEADEYAWDTIQKKFTCCGVESMKDWQNIDGFTDELPKSCCKDDDNVKKCTDAIAHDKGCYSLLVNNVEEIANLLIIVGIGVAAVKVVGIVLICLL